MWLQSRMFLLSSYGFLNPIWQPFAMAMSSVTVVSNSLRLRGFHSPRLAASEVG